MFFVGSPSTKIMSASLPAAITPRSLFAPITVAEVTAATFLPFCCRAGNRLGNGEHVLELDGSMPAGIITPGTIATNVGSALLKFVDLYPGFIQLASCSHDTNKFLHRVLKLGLNLVRILCARAKGPGKWL